MEKLVFLTTQRFDAPSGKFRKRFVGVLSVEIDGVRARKCYAERVIVFQSVIFQHAQGVNNYGGSCRISGAKKKIWGAPAQ